MVLTLLWRHCALSVGRVARVRRAAVLSLLVMVLPGMPAFGNPQAAGSADDAWDAVDAIFEAVDNDASPAASVAIVWDHKLVHARSYGMANIEHGVRATPDTAFPLASMTKQFTAYAVLLLAEQGKLSLDAPVSRYLPELHYDNVTVRQLMNQTGGVPGASLARYGNFSNSSMASLLQMYTVADGLVAEPGTRWAYENSNYFLLDAIVQRVSRKSLAAFLREEVFLPLGMTRSFFPFGPGATHDNRAFGYFAKDGSYQNADAVDYYTDLVGAGGMYASLNDLLRWERAFYAGNEAARGRREDGRYRSGQPVGYGAGLNVRRVDGVLSWEHGGTSGATSTYIAHYPDFGAAIIVLIASDRFRAQGEASAFTQQIRKLLFSRYGVAPVATDDGKVGWSPWSREKLASMTGTWFGDWNGRMQSLALRLDPEGRLQVVMFDGFKPVLKQVGESSFSVEGYDSVKLTLSTDEIVAEDEHKTLATLRRATAPSTLPLADLAGFYTAPALNGGVWTLEWRDGQLAAISPAGQLAPMPPFSGRLIGTNDTGLFLEIDGEPGPDVGLTLRAGQVPPIRMTRTKVRPAIGLLKQVIDAQGADAGWAKYREMRKTPERFDFSEAGFNAFGYQLLQQKRPVEAVAVFAMMVDAYPNSPNALDSLADGQQANGDIAAAIATYERILALQPHQGSAQAALQRLRAAASSKR